MLIDKTTGACLIPLSSYKYPGLYAMVDRADYVLVKNYSWHPVNGRNTFYAQTDDVSSGSQRMHKILTGYKMTDHKDRNGLNNCRDNLRDADLQQNAANARKRSDGLSSPYKGVTWDKKWNGWHSQVFVNGQSLNQGNFANELDAALAYDKAAVEHFGEFALTNAQLGLLPDGWEDHKPEVYVRHVRSSQFKGVTLRKSNSKWRAVVYDPDLKQIHVGQFDDELDAALAHDAYIVEHNLDRPTNQSLGLFNAC